MLDWLTRKNMSQAEFARRMNCSRQYIGQLISGETTMSLEFAINAAHVLGCNENELYSLKLVRNRKE